MATLHGLSLEVLVSLKQDVFPYLLDWPNVDFEGVSEVAVLVVGVRPNGFLLALPVGFIPEEILAVGNRPSPPGLVGPSVFLVVPGKILEDGALSPIGSDVPVLVVDFSEGALRHLRLPGEQELVTYSYDQDHP